jgi:LysM repeat protein
LVASIETPLPSPTPASYTIKSGDTLSQIAERHSVSVDSLLLANAGLNPNALRVGAALLIPGGGGHADFATPTPAPVRILDVACRPMATGAAWCFALLHNDSAEGLEYITGLISIMDLNGAVLASQDVALLLDILPPGTSLPLAVPFSGPLPLDFTPQVRILTATGLAADTPRYLPASVQNTRTNISWSGRAAEVNGAVILPAGTADAAQVWVAAVAYDETGRLVGWRRWESDEGMSAGASMPFRLWVYSLAGAIDRVDLVVQARR